MACPFSGRFFGRLREKLHDEVRQVGRHVKVDQVRRRRLVERQAGQNRHGVGAAEWSAAGRHLVKHDAQAEEVGAMIDRLRPRLLGCHVGRRAENRPRGRDLDVVAQRSRETEIENLDAGFAAGAT